MLDDDLEAIMQIWLETNISTHSFIEETYWKNQYDYVKSVIPESEVYICEKAGQVTGFIGLSGDYIAGLFVSSGFQSQGIGKDLLDHVTFKKELRLSVFQKNLKAIRFYLKEGFLKVAESVDENTGEAEFVMQSK